MSNQIQETDPLPDIPALHTEGPWEAIFAGAGRGLLEAALPRFMLPRRWFGSKARAMRRVVIFETIPILPSAYLLMLHVEYVEGHPETYVIPVAYASGGEARVLSEQRPAAVIASLATGQSTGILYDAVWHPGFCLALLDTILTGRTYRGASGDVAAVQAAVLSRLAGEDVASLPPILLGVEQSNTSVRFGERLIMKLYRRLESGVNPDQEIGQFLTDRGFANTPPLAGVLEFRRREPADAEPITLALLQGFAPNRGDAWKYSLDTLAEYYARLSRASAEGPALPAAALLELVQREIPAEAQQIIGPYVASARLLGRRTAELHLALASDPADPAFTPQPFTAEFQAYLHRSMRGLTGRIMRLLAARLDTLSDAGKREAQQVLDLEAEIMSRFGTLLAQPLHAQLTRVHGDYHLGQVLYTGDDFMIIDFEGEPARPLAERRMKRSALQDVAGMLRSFHYAAYGAYFTHLEAHPSDAHLEPWARFWHAWASAAYLQTYLKVAGPAPFLPAAPAELKLLLDAYLLEKAIYELGYELNNRPTWARIPLQGILQIVGPAGVEAKGQT